MHYNGSGTAVRDENWQSDAAAGIPISAPEMDTEFDGIAVCLTNCITRDSQGGPTADISWGSHKLTSLASGTLSTDAINLGQAQALARVTNMLVNGSFKIQQRATIATLAAAGAYTLDGWFARRNGVDGNYNAKLANVLLPCAYLYRVAASAETTDIVLGQSVDSGDSYTTAGANTANPWAFSVNINKGSTFSGTGVKVEIYYSPNAQQNALTGAGWVQLATSTTAAASVPASGTTALTVSIGADPGAVAIQSICVRISIVAPSGIAGADDSITISRAMLVKGTTVAPTYLETPYAQDFAACQRFYEKSYSDGTTAGAVTAAGSVFGRNPGVVTGIFCAVPFKAQKAKVPTVTLYSTTSGTSALLRDLTGGADVAASATNIGTGAFTAQATGNLSSITGQYQFQWVADAGY